MHLGVTHINHTYKKNRRQKWYLSILQSSVMGSLGNLLPLSLHCLYNTPHTDFFFFSQRKTSFFLYCYKSATKSYTKGFECYNIQLSVAVQSDLPTILSEELFQGLLKNFGFIIDMIPFYLTITSPVCLSISLPYFKYIIK